jgi:large repetitive protein
MKPPVLSAFPSAPSKRSLAPWAIAAICLGSMALLLVTGLVAAGIFVRSRAVAVRQERIQRVRAIEPQTTAFAQTQAEPGITYTNVKVVSEPWSIHVLKIDRSRKDLTFFTAHARDKVLGVSLLADQARAIPREFGRAVAGVNGDFYDRDNPTYAGDPRGLQIVRGEFISAPDTVCVWFDPEGNPHLDEVRGRLVATWPDGRKTPFGLNQRRQPGMATLYTPTYGPSTRASGGRELVLEKDGNGPWLPLQASQTYRARIREVSNNGNTRLASDIMVLSFPPNMVSALPEAAPGTVLQISTETTPDLKDVKMAIGGGPTLIKNGKPAFSMKSPPPGTTGEWRERSKYERHPRAAIGWSPTHIYLLIIDGRQPGLSVGMKLAELADYMVGLGCTEAMNLDGGKSAQMWMNGQIMNSPCQGEDTVANSILVVRKPSGETR